MFLLYVAHWEAQSFIVHHRSQFSVHVSTAEELFVRRNGHNVTSRPVYGDWVTAFDQNKQLERKQSRLRKHGLMNPAEQWLHENISTD